MIRVKVCGLTREEDARAALALGADALGFVLAGSPRRLTLTRAAELAASLPPFTTWVAVLRDPTPDELAAVVRDLRPPVFQFHGEETDELLAGIDRPVIRALPLETEADADAVRAFHLGLPGIPVLVDAGRPGSGRACRWDLAAGLARTLPVILAGGLDPENVQDAVRTVRPAGVDVSSGVESAPGIKDPERIEAFIARARSADLQVRGFRDR